jgi:hypothetical protein
LETRLPALGAKLKRRSAPDPSAKVRLRGAGWSAVVRLKPLPDGQSLSFKASFPGDASSDVARSVQELLGQVRASAALPAAPVPDEVPLAVEVEPGPVPTSP